MWKALCLPLVQNFRSEVKVFIVMPKYLVIYSMIQVELYKIL